MRSAFIPLALGLAAGLAFSPPPAAAQTATFEWSGRMAPGEVLDVKGISGRIRAVPASGDRAEVVARKRGDADDFGEVAIETVETADGIIICAVYGSWNHGRGQCDPRNRDRSQDRDRHRNVSIDVSVEYEVHVPAGVSFEGSLVSGSVQADALRSDVRANTVDGDITISTTGRAWGNTVSGDMEIEMGEVGPEDLDFNTVSGDIVLWLPNDFAADVDFESLSGDFSSDFDITISSRRHRWIGSRVQGTIGGGGRDLTLRTVSGNVEIRRR